MKERERKLIPLKDNILGRLTREPILVPGQGVTIQPLSAGYADAFTQQYRRAYARGDFFGGRYSDPESQIFNPEWVKREIDNPDHSWIIFTDEEGTLLGSTALFHNADGADGVNVETSDETQIDPLGRGRAIMPHFFRRVVPVLEELEVRFAADFLLTPGSKSLRRTLQGELGMTALGIHPHVLAHRESGLTRSEISSAKFVTLEPQVVTIMPELEPLFRIVQEQLSLPDPEVIAQEPVGSPPRFTDKYEEIIVSAAGLAEQRRALASGYHAVAFDPKANIFKMATFPEERPNLDFILDNETVEPNKRLVEYLYQNLYKYETDNRQDEGGVMYAQ